MNERMVNERAYLARIRTRLDELARFFDEQRLPTLTSTAAEWHTYLAAMKAVAGHASNDLSFIACLMAKEYLDRTLLMCAYDAAAKPQGAAGLDIDERTIDGARVVAEIKTTVPTEENALGAQQKTMIAKDIAKLNAADADHKFFFVTDPSTFDLVVTRYAATLPGVKFVLLTTGEEYPSSSGATDRPR